SVLQDIQGPDVTGSMAKGFALKDLVTNTQLNTLRASVEKTDMDRKERARAILSEGGDSTDEEVANKQERLRKAGLGPEAMDYRMHAQSVRSGDFELQTQKIQAFHAQQNEIND